MIPTRSLTAIGTFAAAAAAVAAAAAAMPGVAHADEFKTYIGQATTLLNVRSTPSTRQPKIGRFSPGDTFKVTGVAGKSEKGNWLQITYQNKTAYVDGTYVTQKQQPAANKKPTQSVQSIQHYQVFTTDNLNVRFLPGISGTVLTTLKKGSAVTVTGKTADGWLQISYKGGSAYVSEKYVQSGSTPRLSAKASVTVQYKGTTTDNLNVRTGATTSAKRLTTLK
ncbi:SH3 domain-containing protein, partial [Sporolactobacillus vineae]